MRCRGSRALGYLGRGERALRASGLPQLIYRGAKRFDVKLERRFDEYIHETAARLAQIDRLLSGEVPAWRAEPSFEPKPPGGSAPVLLMHQANLLPVDFFRKTFR